MRRGPVTAVVLGVAMAATACEDRDANRKCTAMLLEGKAAVTRGDTVAAKGSLSAARETCPKSRSFYVERLAEQIDGKEKEQAAAKLEAAEAERAREAEPLRAFAKWVGTIRDSSEKRERATRCVARGNVDYGFCDTTKEVSDGLEYRTRFFEADPRAFRSSISVLLPVGCEDLGPRRLVRAWTASVDGAEVEREHCEMTGGPLKGLQALVSVAGERHEVSVFSREFVRRHAGTSELLDEAR